MTAFDPNSITPPPERMDAWVYRMGVNESLRAAYRAGAAEGYAAGKTEWPEPITDRPPTEADGDEKGVVQYTGMDARWDFEPWHAAASLGHPWRHSPGWRPPAPKEPTLREQALDCLTTLEADLKMHGFGTNLDVVRRALEAES